MSKLTVKEIMKTGLITVSPDTTIEKAVALAQTKKVGCLPVVEDDRVVGIITTNDVFYKVLNPLLGVGATGARIIVYDAGTREESHKVMDVVIKTGLKVQTFWIPPIPDKFDLVLHLDTNDATSIIEQLRGMGYKVDLRDYNP